MVNTRRTSQALQSDESRAQAAEQSDSSTTSTARRSTRRSVGNIPSTPVEIPTPTRRSRRLSNSSIESANNDTPRPVARRSTRSKTAGSDNETSDVELVVIKRRKLVEGVDTLIPISEEKPEEHANFTKGKESHVLVELDEEKEEETSQESEVIDVSQDRVVNAKSPAKIVETKNIKSPVKIEIARSPVKTENARSPVKMEDNLEGKAMNERVIEDVRSPKKVANVGPGIKKADEVDGSSGKGKIAVPTVVVSEEKLHSTEEHNQENFFTPVSTPTNLEDSENTACKTNDKQQSPKALGDIQITATECNVEQEEKNKRLLDSSPLKEANAKNDSDIQITVTECTVEQEEEENRPLDSSPLKEANAMITADSPDKPRMLFGVPVSRITVNKSLMMKKTGKKNPAERKIRRPRKKVEPAKESLPCGADIMRNIPRGKSKSGREWKEPKSNPRYLYQDKGLKMPFEKITQLRQERQRVKDLENRMKEEERARRAEITRRRAVNKQREEENARRGEVVQVIRNTNKIKRMKKKQLKLIQKRDTTKVV